jgi:hypothetical protein
MQFVPVPKVDRNNPRIYVNMQWAEEPAGVITLWVRRMGEPDEFAYYPALEVWGGRITFQFDELVFEKLPGRFKGRLLVAGIHKADIEFDYVSADKVLSVENTNV